ncbi:cell envelope integrity protein TolA [Klebsiella sp. CN_Kp114]|uniref:cell envelope integrity protein TolA n=1 Tax=unclassified Klebsiella TaxID=2608929 RepID=UPI0032B49749
MMRVKNLYLLLVLSGTAFADELPVRAANAVPERQINNYVSAIMRAIQSEFYEASKYKGKECDLNLKIGRDGNVLDATVERGDKELCQRALNAVSYAKLPKPPSDEVWNRVKKVTLAFKP